jgi:serine/threonine protein kinase
MSSRIYLSYAREDASQTGRIMELADFLASLGHQVSVDFYESEGAEGWTRWIATRVSEADCIICVCTEQYRKSFDGPSGEGAQRGEASVILRRAYRASIRGASIVPVLLDQEPATAIPLLLRGLTYYRFPRDRELLAKQLGGSGDKPEGPRPRTPSYDIFIAHAAKDTAIARRLHQKLSKEFRVFLDVEVMQPGDDWELATEAALKNSTWALVVWSREAANSRSFRSQALSSVLLSRERPANHRTLPLFVGRQATDAPLPPGMETFPGIMVRSRKPADVDLALSAVRTVMATVGSERDGTEALRLKHPGRTIEGALPAAGDLVAGRYLIDQLIGVGGFGAIYRSVDRHSLKHVVIKLLNTQAALDPVMQERFLRGARIASALTHPNIARVLQDRGEHQGRVFYVMEYLPRGDLASAVHRREISLERISRVLSGVAAGLQFCHSRGIAHRDLKPSNILLDDDFTPKISDFDLMHGGDVTMSRSFVGTFVYSAPELLAGETVAAGDPAADIYSLAMTTLFMLSGGELTAQVVRDPRPVVSSLTVPAAAKTILLRGLDFFPANRPSNASEFAEAIVRSLNGGTTRTRRKTSVATPKSSNPFRPGTALPGERSPPGREADVRQLMARVQTRAGAALIGPRRSGKTSLLHHLRHRLASDHYVRYASLERHRCDSPAHLAVAIEPSVARTRNPAAAFEKILAEHRLHGREPVLLVDEVGYLRNADTAIQPTVFGWLRGIGQELASIVYAGSAEDWRQVMDRARETPGSSFGNDLLSVTLRPLAIEAAATFLQETAPSDVPIPARSTGRWIIERCGTWPFYLQIMGHAIVEEVRAGRSELLTDKSTINMLFDDAVIKGYSHLFRDHWRELPLLARQVILSGTAEELPDVRELSRADRQALRSAYVYDEVEGWLIANDPPFLQWLRRSWLDLTDELEETR